MTIVGPGRRHRREHLPRLQIGADRISQMTNMTILGVPITNKLALCTKDETLLSKIRTAKRFLRQLHTYNILEDMTEWRTVLEATLRSILEHLAAPILTIDQRGRAWSNKQFMQAITYIFAWPKNISQNMIHLMLGMENTEDSIYKQLIKGGTYSDKRMREDYALMAQLYIQGGIKSYITENTQCQEGQRQEEQHIHNSRIIRHHFDPARELRISTGVATNKGILIWLVTNHIKQNIVQQL